MLHHPRRLLRSKRPQGQRRSRLRPRRPLRRHQHQHQHRHHRLQPPRPTSAPGCSASLRPPRKALAPRRCRSRQHQLKPHRRHQPWPSSQSPRPRRTNDAKSAPKANAVAPMRPGHQRPPPHRPCEPRRSPASRRTLPRSPAAVTRRQTSPARCAKPRQARAPRRRRRRQLRLPSPRWSVGRRSAQVQPMRGARVAMSKGSPLCWAPWRVQPPSPMPRWMRPSKHAWRSTEAVCSSRCWKSPATKYAGRRSPAARRGLVRRRRRRSMRCARHWRVERVESSTSNQPP